MAPDQNRNNRTWAQRAKGVVQNPPPPGVLLVIFLVALGEFVADVFTNLGICDWVWYFIPLLLSVYINRRFFSYLLATVFSLLIITGFYLSPLTSERHEAFISRCAGICVVWLIALFLDERKRVEVKLRASEDRYRLVVEDQTEVISRFTADGTFTYVNDVYCRFFGKTRQELLGSKWHPRAVEEDLPMIKERFDTLSPSRPVVIIENRIYNGAGEVHWFQFVNHAFFDAAGVLVEAQSVGRDITDRKRLEEHSGRMEERYRSLAESSPDAIFILDRVLAIQFVNRAGASWLGKPAAELLGRPQAEFFPPETSRQQQEFLRRVFETGEMLQIERSHPFNGEEKWIETRLIPLRDPAGKVLSVMGISRDLTDRKRAERQLATLAHAVKSTTEMICITDLDDRFIYLNDTFQKVYGYAEGEILGKTPEILLSSKNPPSLLQEILKQSRLGGWRGEVIDRRKDGTELPIFLSTSQVKDHDGVVIGLMGISQDITEAKKIEARLEELAAIVQSSEDGIISTTTEEIIVSWNKGAEHLLGYTAAEMIGENILMIVPPEQSEKARQIIRKVAQGESVESYEAVRRHKDGTLRDLSAKVSRVTNAAGKVISIAVIYRDITARKQLEKTVLEISAGERQRIGYDLHDGLGQYLAGIAFKTKALEETLLRESPALAGEAMEISGLVNNAISQTRSLARGLAPVAVEVNGLLAALENLAAETKNLFPVHCVFGANINNLELHAQTGMVLYRITQEAIHNAATRGGADRITINLQLDDGRVCLTIRDDGKGFLVESKPKTGMGLRIMQYRANSIGGTLTIHSQIGKGTEVKCIVPKKL